MESNSALGQILEAAIDRMEKEPPSPKAFIIPDGHISAAWAHMARIVRCRAERQTVSLSAEYDEAKAPGQIGEVLIFLDRRSARPLVPARYCSQLHGVPKVPWKK
ncbi:MAG: ATP:cob(I)alamin adenosyltransferase [Deltaproteobacteria bacterium]|nr:ATP:cob(I)alamin adenosyltransferase [Deltaproteobacteria bacterium]